MLKLIKCEFLKLKRLRFIQITLILAVLFPIVLTMYVFKTGNNFEMLYRFVFLYGDLLFKPCVLGIIGLMLLSTEDDNDTFKNLLSIPISRRKLFYAKISLLLLLSMLYSFFELLATSIGGLFLGGIQ
ncbi:TPA: ABC transporter permease, partial [Enterococcus faecalis]|nr:ABC transporter permease [Enterococcus faecalis]